MSYSDTLTQKGVATFFTSNNTVWQPPYDDKGPITKVEIHYPDDTCFVSSHNGRTFEGVGALFKQGKFVGAVLFDDEGKVEYDGTSQLKPH